MKTIEVHTKGIPYGGMVWWKQVDETARYLVHLYIAEKNVKFEIACVVKDRNTLYHTFTDLAVISKVEDDYTYIGVGSPEDNETDYNYYVIVEAEDRNGNVLAKSKYTDLEPLTYKGNK